MRDTTSTFAPTEADAERPLTRDGSQDLIDDRPGTTPSHLRSVVEGAPTLRPMTVPSGLPGFIGRSQTRSFPGMLQEFQSQAGGSVDPGEEELQSPGKEERKGQADSAASAAEKWQRALPKPAAGWKKLPILGEKMQTSPPASQLQASGSQDHGPSSPDLPNLGARSGSSGTSPRGSMLPQRGFRAHVLQALSTQKISVKEDTSKSDVAGDSKFVPGMPEHLPQAETAMRSLAKPPGSAGHSATSPRKKSVYRTTTALTEIEAEVERSSFFEVRKVGKG